MSTFHPLLWATNRRLSWLMAIEGEIEVAISQPILVEVLCVLRIKFQHFEEEVAETEDRIRGFTQMVTPTQALNVITDDPDDNRILECAVASGSECIVTGDKDLLRIREYEGSRIVRVADFLASAC